MLNLKPRLRHWLTGRPNPMLDLALALRDSFVHPRVVTPMPGERVLVLAPHMDDEAIGCGGALLLHVAAGNEVTVVYLSDGSAGDARLYDPAVPTSEHAALRAALRVTRRREAQAWCQAAGIGAPEFLDGPDGRLDSQLDELAAGLARLLDRVRPQLLYLPSLLDTHPDHHAANAIAAAALMLRPMPGCRLRGYEVWSPLSANRVIDIGGVFARKLELLALYASQLKDVDYARAIGGLNTYRSMLLPGRTGQAEAFVELTTVAHRAALRGVSAAAQRHDAPAATG